MENLSLADLLLTGLQGLVVATVLAGVIAPVVIAVYRRRRWLDDPIKAHVKKLHDAPLPRGGGLIVGFALLVCIPILLPLTPQILVLLAAIVLLVIVGTLDDIYDIHPFWRLGAGVVAAELMISQGLGITFLSHPSGEGVLTLANVFSSWPNASFMVGLVSHLLTLLFINWNINIVNWSKGVDGQMPGFVAISALFVGILSLRFAPDPSQWSVLTLSWIVAGAYIGFLIWNWYPQKAMAGYGAGSIAGFMLSVLAILSGARLATTLMVLAIPTADAVFTVSRRLLARKSPWWGDRGHLHHKLMDVLGWGKRRIAVFYWLSSLAMGILSLYLDTIGKMIVLVLCGAAVFSFLVWAKLRQHRALQSV